MSPGGLTITRIIFATVLFWTASLSIKKKAVKKKDLLLLAFSGLFGFTIPQVLFNYALHTSTPVPVSLTVAMSAVIVMLLAALLLKEKITQKRVFGVILAVFGVFVLIFRLGYDTISSADTKGIIITFISITFYSLYIVLTR